MLYATPLLVVLLVIETADLLFAVDSIPAVLAVTREPFVVLSSNIFAILGLRALFFVLAGVIDRFHYLKVAVCVILVFVGSKMLLTHTALVISTPISLSVILGVLTTAAALSIWRERRAPRPDDGPEVLSEHAPSPPPPPEEYDGA
jgi:tellurite resistance protein TerC